MSRKDQRRRERLERERIARGKKHERPPPEPPPPVVAPDQKPVVDRGPNWPNVEQQYKPGQTGNPGGYSKARRFTDGVLDLITERKADRQIAVVWLKEVLEGNHRYMKTLLERAEGLLTKDAIAPIVTDAAEATIDPATAERLMAAAEPETVPLLEDEET